MPSISANASRHVTIDRREGEYLCFPDVCTTASGRLICAYNEYDQHVATRRGLLVRTSDDLGQTWSPPQKLSRNRSHCPRLTVLTSGQVQLLDYNGVLLYTSDDNGTTWSAAKKTERNHRHVVADRPLELADGTLLSAAHSHRGTNALPNLRQAPTEQMVFQSTDNGKTYAPYSVLHADRFLVLCEASICRLPDGRLAALMRENSQTFEPMYLCLSEDEGASWSEPHPTPLVGHRPTMNVTSSGKLLVTYRDVGPDCGTAAWLGSLTDLLGPYLVHGLGPAATTFTSRAMHIPPDRHTPACWALRPMTDARTATAIVEYELQALSEDGISLHMGVWWQLHPDHIKAMLPAGKGNKQKTLRRKIPANQLNTLRFTHKDGTVTLHVNNRKRAEINVDASLAATRIMLLGTKVKASASLALARISQHITEPRMVREYRWDWDHTQGLPHAAKLAAVLEIKNDRHAHYGDFGYSGWCALPDGRFFCVYHHADAQREDYTPNFDAHICGVWFTEEDFRPASA